MIVIFVLANVPPASLLDDNLIKIDKPWLVHASRTEVNLNPESPTHCWSVVDMWGPLNSCDFSPNPCGAGMLMACAYGVMMPVARKQGLIGRHVRAAGAGEYDITFRYFSVSVPVSDEALSARFLTSGNWVWLTGHSYK